MNARKPHAGCELNNTVGPLYMKLQVFMNFQRCKCAFSCPGTYINSPVWSTLLHVFSLYQQLCFCVLYCSHEIKRHLLLGRKVMTNLDSIFKSRDVTLPTTYFCVLYCSHDIKRRLLLGRKVMTNLDSILKSRDITLPRKVCLVKAMVFPVVMYGCESWTLKKAER